MTFCLGMRVKDGLVGIADTRVTSGSECITARKVSIYQGDGWSMFMMTSGLRSVRDKSLTYFDEIMEDLDQPPESRLFKMANLFAQQVRRVAQEDQESLEKSGLSFNMHTLVGGQLADDADHKLYMIYPEGNWVEIGEGTPYHIIGASGYGKPVLDRTLKYDDSLQFALKVGTLAFDSTRISAADVDFPVDIVLYVRDSYRMDSQRFEKNDLLENSELWQERLRKSVRELSLDWAQPLLDRLPDVQVVSMQAKRVSG
ncbi:MAG TPA: proteasome-type protease [Lacipirellulaceae bacterium]|nr:proteasome-type protease [Lacipirellulaceae bacterium]